MWAGSLILGAGLFLEEVNRGNVMAYDLVVKKTRQIRDKGDLVGSIDFDELPSISRLIKRCDASFLHHISNICQDQSFSLAESEKALSLLFPLLTETLREDERAMLHKLIAVLSYAINKKQNLYGVAD